MLVSSFDISSWSWGSTANRSTRSTYWLELTNLADRDIQFEFAAHVTRYSSGFAGQPTDPAAKLAELKNLVSGALAGDNWTWYAGGWGLEDNHPVLRLTVPVPANSSQPVRLQPSYLSGKYPQAAGYVELTVPVIRLDKPPFNWIPQYDRPVPVLLYPSTDEDAAQNGAEISSARQSLPLANGQAYNEIPPNTELRTWRIPIRDLLLRNPAFLAGAAAGSPDEDAVRSLVDQLTALGADDRAALNELLQTMESPLRIENPD